MKQIVVGIVAAVLLAGCTAKPYTIFGVESRYDKVNQHANHDHVDGHPNHDHEKH